MFGFQFGNGGKGNKFDLNGDLSIIPIGYLVVVLKRASRASVTAERLTAIAAEVKKRGGYLSNRLQHVIKREVGGTCEHESCERRGIYIIGTKLFCRAHKGDAYAIRERLAREAAPRLTAQAKDIAEVEQQRKRWDRSAEFGRTSRRKRKR